MIQKKHMCCYCYQFVFVVYQICICCTRDVTFLILSNGSFATNLLRGSGFGLKIMISERLGLRRAWITKMRSTESCNVYGNEIHNIT